MEAATPGSVPARSFEQENELIRTVFDKDQKLLKAMRAVMLNLDPTPDEKTLVRSAFESDALFAAISHRFIPQLNKNAPIGMLQDVWLGVEEMIFGRDPDTIFQAVQYKKIAIECTQIALLALRDPDISTDNLSYKPMDLDLARREVQLQTWLLGRNQFIKHVETQLKFLDNVVQAAPESPAEQKKRAKKDSAE